MEIFSLQRDFFDRKYSFKTVFDLALISLQTNNYKRLPFRIKYIVQMTVHSDDYCQKLLDYFYLVQIFIPTFYFEPQ